MSILYLTSHHAAPSPKGISDPPAMVRSPGLWRAFSRQRDWENNRQQGRKHEADGGRHLAVEEEKLTP